MSSLVIYTDRQYQLCFLTIDEVVVATQNVTSTSEARRVGKFGLVGLINTVIDFALYNVLSGPVGLTLVQSNLISTTVAMVFSFFANKQLVFENRTGSVARQAVMFYIVTAFGLYVLQTGVIKLLTEAWLTPVHLAVFAVHGAGLAGHDSFIIKNTAKIIGTLVSLTWNYFAYKKLVFT